MNLQWGWMARKDLEVVLDNERDTEDPMTRAALNKKLREPDAAAFVVVDADYQVLVGHVILTKTGSALRVNRMTVMPEVFREAVVFCAAQLKALAKRWHQNVIEFVVSEDDFPMMYALNKAGFISEKKHTGYFDDPTQAGYVMRYRFGKKPSTKTEPSTGRITATGKTIWHFQ